MFKRLSGEHSFIPYNCRTYLRDTNLTYLCTHVLCVCVRVHVRVHVRVRVRVRARACVCVVCVCVCAGGVVSRPGMAFTNIIGRSLGKEVLNFGYSGQGQV